MPPRMTTLTNFHIAIPISRRHYPLTRSFSGTSRRPKLRDEILNSFKRGGVPLTHGDRVVLYGYFFVASVLFGVSYRRAFNERIPDLVEEKVAKILPGLVQEEVILAMEEWEHRGRRRGVQPDESVDGAQWTADSDRAHASSGHWEF